MDIIQGNSVLVVTIAVILTISFLLSELMYRLKYPRIIGHMIAGIIIGIPWFRFLLSEEMITDINFFSELGMIFMLFLAGLEINKNLFKEVSRKSAVIATSSVLLSFFATFFFMQFLGFNTIISIVVGVCLSISAEVTTIKLLIDLGKLDTKIGTTIIAAGLFDDLIGVFFIAVIGQGTITKKLAPDAVGNILISFLNIMLFIVITMLLFKLVPKIIRAIQKEKSREAEISTLIIIGLGIAALSVAFGIEPMIGAFVAGIIVQESNKDKEDEAMLVENIKLMTFTLIIPFFFVGIGISLDWSGLFTNPLFILGLILIAIFGKLAASLIVMPITKFRMDQSLLIGWAMNSRGVIELVIAEVARRTGIISSEIYSAIVFVAVISILIFPLAMKHMLKKDPQIMD